MDDSIFKKRSSKNLNQGISVWDDGIGIALKCIRIPAAFYSIILSDALGNKYAIKRKKLRWRRIMLTATDHNMGE